MCEMKVPVKLQDSVEAFKIKGGWETERAGVCNDELLWPLRMSQGIKVLL